MYSHILIPIAFDQENTAMRALEVAKALLSEGGDVTFLHAIEPVPSYAMQYIPPDLTQATRDGIKTELEGHAEKISGGSAAIVDGHPGRSICDWAAQNNTDLIIMASHQPGVSDIIWGSTAAHVVRHVHCAVHVLR